MTTNKSKEFTTTDQELARFAKALSHPARVAILKYLAETKACITGDISENLPISKTTVFQHIQELKKINLLKGEIDGKRLCYCINEIEYERLKSKFNEFFNQTDNLISNCC